MATEVKIKVTKNDDALQQLKNNLKAAEREFANLKLTGTATASALAGASDKIRSLNTQFKDITSSVRNLKNEGKGLSLFQKLEIGENLSSIARGFIEVGRVVGAAVQQVAQFSIESANLAAELEVLKSNFGGSAADLELFKKAVAGTVSEAGLIKLSNQASDLGVSLKDQSLLFSLAEDAADKYGGSVEENFQKVIFASDGTARGLRAVGISVGAFNEEVKKLTDSMGVNLSALDADAQMNVRLQAIYNLTGTTIEKVNQKTADSKDKLDALKVKAEELKTEFGNLVLSGLTPLIDKLLESGKATQTVTGGVIAFGGSIVTLLPLVANLRLATQGLNFSMLGLAKGLGVLGLVIAAFETASFLTDKINENAKTMDKIAPGTSDTMPGKDASLENYFKSGKERGKILDNMTTQTDKQTESNKKNTESLKELGNKLKSVGKNVGKSDLPFVPTNTELTEQEKYIQNLKEINELLKFARGINAPPSELTGRNIISKSGLENLAGNVQGLDKAKTPAELRDELLSGLSEAGNKLISIANVFGLNMESTTGKILSGFQDILSLLQTFIDGAKTVNTIVSIIGTLFGGGASPLPSGNSGTRFNNAAPMLTAGFRNAQVREVPYIVSTNVSGKNLRLVLTRSDNLENSRVTL